MKIANVRIERKPSYHDHYPNQLVGLVQLEGTSGKMEVKLTNKTLAQVFAIIKTDCEQVAKKNASHVKDAISEAENEQYAIDEPVINAIGE